MLHCQVSCLVSSLPLLAYVVQYVLYDTVSSPPLLGLEIESSLGLRLIL